MENYITTLITVAGALIGCMLGGVSSYFFQMSADRKKYNREKEDSIRNIKVTFYTEVLRNLKYGSIYPKVYLYEKKIQTEIKPYEIINELKQINSCISENYSRFILLSNEKMTRYIKIIFGLNEKLIKKFEIFADTKDSIDINVSTFAHELSLQNLINQDFV